MDNKEKNRGCLRAVFFVILIAVYAVGFILIDGFATPNRNSGTSLKGQERDRFLTQTIQTLGLGDADFQPAHIDHSKEPKEVEPYAILKRDVNNEGELGDWDFHLSVPSDPKVIVVVDSDVVFSTYLTDSGTEQTGFTENADMYFYNVEEKCFYDQEHFSGEELPKNTTGHAPHYTISIRDISDAIDKHLGLDHGQITYADQDKIVKYYAIIGAVVLFIAYKLLMRL